MRIIVLISLLFMSCSKTPSQPPSVICHMVRKPISEPTTGGPAETSTLKDPSDAYFMSLDMFRRNPELSPEEREKIVNAYRRSVSEAERMEAELRDLKSAYFRAVVQSEAGGRSASALKADIFKVVTDQISLSLDFVDSIAKVIGPKNPVDRDFLQRAFLREERQQRYVEEMPCAS